MNLTLKGLVEKYVKLLNINILMYLLINLIFLLKFSQFYWALHYPQT